MHHFSQFKRIVHPNLPDHQQEDPIPTFINLDNILMIVETIFQNRTLTAIELNTGKRIFIADSFDFIFNHKVNKQSFMKFDLLGRKSDDHSSLGEFFELPIKTILNFNFVLKFASIDPEIIKNYQNYDNKIDTQDLIAIELCTGGEIIVKNTCEQIYKNLTGKALS